MIFDLLESLMRYELEAYELYSRMSARYPELKEIAEDELRHIKIVARVIELVSTSRTYSVGDAIKAGKVNVVAVSNEKYDQVLHSIVELLEGDDTVFLSFRTPNMGWKVKFVEKRSGRSDESSFTTVNQIPMKVEKAKVVIVDSLSALEVCAGEDAKKLVYYLSRKSREEGVTVVIVYVHGSVSEELEKFAVSVADSYTKFV